MTQPNRAAFISILLFLPFFLLNLMVSQDIEPIDSFFRSVISLDGLRTNPLGHLVFLVCIMLIPVGSIIALRHAIQSGTDGKRQVHAVNLILGAITMLFFVMVAGALITEVYRCDMMLIPNCD